MDTSPELDLHLCTERNRAYKGRAKVQIRWLSFDDWVRGTRPLDPKNVARLVKIFNLEGCFRREPEHYVPALISPKALDVALTQANCNAGELFAVTEEPVSLELSNSLICLHGRHRLEAAKQYLDTEDKWWVVDLYSDDIHDDAKVAIMEEYSNSRNFSDGDIFRNLRYHQMNNNKQEAGKWMARLSESKWRDVIQLQKMALQSTAMGALSDAFNRLLPYRGLWSALQLSTFHRLLTLRCPEELTHYLHLIEKTWKLILSAEDNSSVRLDTNTVRLLQTRCLCYSSEDHAAVTTDMDNGVLFPNIPNQHSRGEIMVSLEKIGYMIPSLHTFLEDTKYLEPCAKIVKSLLPVKFKGTIREAFGKNHTGLSQCQVQLDEHAVSEHRGSVRECIWIAYRQIWLFAMRHFPDMIGICPRKDDGKPKPTVHRPDENLWHKIAELAGNCGFQTSAIAEYTRRNPFQKMASEFLRQCRPPEYYDISTAALNTAVGLIVRILQGIEPRVIDFKLPPLTSDYRDNTDLADRCGRPFEQSFLDDKKYMFYQHIYDNRSEQWTLQQSERYLTSFKAKHDIFIAFFGRLDEEPEDPPPAMDVHMEDQAISTETPQASGYLESTGAPQHSPETSNIPSAQTDTFQPIDETQRRQDVSQSDIVHAEEAMGNNGQLSESRVTDEGAPPDTQLRIVSQAQLQGQEDYSMKRQRMEDTQQQADASDALMFDTPTPAAENEVAPAQTEEYSNDDLVAAELELTARPVTMMQSSSSQQQAVVPIDIPESSTPQWLAEISESNNQFSGLEGAPSSSHPFTMRQSTFPQQQESPYSFIYIPSNQKTSDYIKSHLNHPRENIGSYISLVDVNTRQIHTCQNNFDSFINWWTVMSIPIQFLAIDRGEKVHCVPADDVFANATNSGLPIILYEEKGHSASWHDRTLMDFDVIDFDEEIL